MRKGKKMKISMIGQKGIPIASGGIEKHVEEIGLLLAQNDMDVVVYNRSGYVMRKQKNYNGIKIVTVPTLKIKGIEAVVYSFFASIHAAFSDTDIVHYHALGPSAMCWIPKIFRKKVVVTVHGLDWQREKWGKFGKLFLKKGEKRAARYADEIIVVGKKLVQYFKEKYNRDTIFIPNGIRDMQTLENHELEKWDLKDKKYILFLARVVPEKGCHYLLEAFKNLSQEDVVLVVAGGSGQTDAYYNNLKEKFSSDKILFIGEVSGKSIGELYSNALLYVLPSDIEGLPISLLEAMSCGTCCLVSDIQENMDVIELSGKFGFCFKAGNSVDLKNQMEALLHDENSLREIGQKARKHVLQSYKWESVVLSLSEVYGGIS
ncbi:glycosyltransferase family 4 protein [Anaerosacchariphilus polymeriproducens]|nr:glycosyltransferase family 4 protein [Anaerosacchariphilus polymeriproducens]